MNKRGVAVDDRLGQPDRADARTRSASPQRRTAPAPPAGRPTPRCARSPHSGGRCGRPKRWCGRFPALLYCSANQTPEAPMAGHDHDHDHHDHEHGSELSETQLRVRALETVLTEKGYIDPAALDAIIEAYETKIGPRNGAVVVAKAWTDPGVQEGAAGGRHQGGRLDGPHEPRRRSSGRGREHAEAPQHDRLHAVLLLSVGGARPAAGLVQVGAVPLARGEGPARRARRLRRRRCRRTPKSACGIPPPRRASSCCRCGPPAPKAGARTSSPIWSPATR